MIRPLAAQCFWEGFNQALSHLMASKSAHVKKAGPLAERELSLLGEKVFRHSFDQPDVMKGLYNIFLPRYGQVAAAHALRNNYLQNVLRLSRQMRSIGPSNPAYGGLVKQVQNATSAFRPAQQQLFGEIGSAVKPRLDFMNRTLPLAGGLGVGGAAGYGLGHWSGQRDEAGRIQEGLGDVPLMTRLQYLFNPSGTFKSSAFMGGLPRTMGTIPHNPVAGFGRNLPKLTPRGLGNSRITQPGMGWTNTATMGTNQGFRAPTSFSTMMNAGRTNMMGRGTFAKSL